MKILSDTATPKLFIGIEIRKRSWYSFTATDLTNGKGFSRKASPEALWKYVEKNYSNYQVPNKPLSSKPTPFERWFFTQFPYVGLVLLSASG